MSILHRFKKYTYPTIFLQYLLTIQYFMYLFIIFYIFYIDILYIANLLQYI